MKKRDHERIIRAMRQRHQTEVARAASFWQAEAEQLQQVADAYAKELDKMDRKLAGREIQVSNLQYRLDIERKRTAELEDNLRNAQADMYSLAAEHDRRSAELEFAQEDVAGFLDRYSLGLAARSLNCRCASELVSDKESTA